MYLCIEKNGSVFELEFPDELIGTPGGNEALCGLLNEIPEERQPLYFGRERGPEEIE